MFRKTLFWSLFVIGGIYGIHAQETLQKHWVRTGFAGLKLTQVSLTNWAPGGNSSVAFDLQGNYEIDYTKNKHLWKNRMELAYGMTKIKGENLQKNNDKIYFNSSYGYALTKKLYLSGLLNFQSQFSPGYDYSVSKNISISDFMAPGYLTIGPGISWIPNRYFNLFFSPISWKGTFVLNDRLSQAGAFGVKPGDKLLSEWGANLRLEGKYEFMKNMSVYSRAEFFSDYTRKPQNIAVNWEVQLNMTINKWFSATLNTNLVYDDDIKIATAEGNKGARVQFKEVLGVGLQFNF